MADRKIKGEVTPAVARILIAHRERLLQQLAELDRDCFEPVEPPTHEELDRLHDAVVKALARTRSMDPEDVETDTRKHRTFARALMNAAWLAGYTADGVSACEKQDTAQKP